VRAPARDARDGKERSIHFGGNAEHSVYES
jgi:hypothetical protein